jgi:hypothetical protein
MELVSAPVSSVLNWSSSPQAKERGTPQKDKLTIKVCVLCFCPSIYMQRGVCLLSLFAWEGSYSEIIVRRTARFSGSRVVIFRASICKKIRWGKRKSNEGAGFAPFFWGSLLSNPGLFPFSEIFPRMEAQKRSHKTQTPTVFLIVRRRVGATGGRRVRRWCSFFFGTKKTPKREAK